LIIDSLGPEAKRFSEVVVLGLFSTEVVDIQNPKEFACIVHPGEATLLYFYSFGPTFRLRVDGDTLTYPEWQYSGIRTQVSGDIVVTEAAIARGVISEEEGSFPPKTVPQLHHAELALFVENRDTMMMLNLLSRHPCYYSILRIQDLEENLLKGSGSGIPGAGSTSCVVDTKDDRRYASKRSGCWVS
jgi:hypothetical protein